MVQHQGRRPRIDADAIAETGLGVLGADIVGQGLQAVGDAAVQQVLDAGLGLFRTREIRVGQVVIARAGMGIDDTKRTAFGAQQAQEGQKRRVFGQIGEIAGVITVSVIHSPRAFCVFLGRAAAIIS